MLMAEEVYKSISQRSQTVFLNPVHTYSYEEIVLGCMVVGKDGRCEKMFAVARNTWRGFHKLDKEGEGAGSVFMGYFARNKADILNRLRSMESSLQLDEFEDEICSDIRSGLKNIRQDMLKSYNKVRKPVDLYIEHIVSMASELDGERERLAKLLFMPLDSQMFQSPLVFENGELFRYGITRGSTFKDVDSRHKYKGLQDILAAKAASVSSRQGVEFQRIYFDLLWNDRFKKDGGNLFETNL